MTFFAFLWMALRRLANGGWRAARPGRVCPSALTLFLVATCALTVGLLVCVPLFVDAISLQILQEEIERKTDTQDCPPFAVRFTVVPGYGEPMSLEEADYDRTWIADMLRRAVGLPIRAAYAQSDSPVLYLSPLPGDRHYNTDILAPVQVTVVRDVAAHITLLSGQALPEYSPAASEPPAPPALSLWMERRFADDLAVQVGESFVLADPRDRGAKGVPVKIAGIWEATDPQDRSFWSDPPARLLEQRLLTTEEQYRTFIYPARPERTESHRWYYVLDERQMSFARAQHYVDGLRAVQREVDERLTGGRMDFSPLAELEKGLARRASLTVILLSLSLPLLAMLFCVLAHAAATAARFQRQEVAMLASRGAGRLQLMAVKALEGLVIVGLGVPLGLGVGYLLAQLTGHAQGFLTFVPRLAVGARSAGFQPPASSWPPQAVDWRLVALGVTVLVGLQIAPHWAASGQSIVSHERWSARRGVVLGGMRGLLVGTLALAAYYSYRRLAAIGSLSLIGWQPGDPSYDPLLLLAPSLYLFAMPAVASELFVLAIRPLALLARAAPTSSAYLGCVILGREGEQYRAPVFMLVLCLCLGIYYASLGKSADVWLLDRRAYETGADLVFTLRPNASPNVPVRGAPASERANDAVRANGAVGQNASGSSMLLLPISDYEAINGVARAARVAEFPATVFARQFAGLRLLAVDPADLASVAYFRRDFSAYPLGELMNRLAARGDGLLVPARLAEKLQIAEGDQIALSLRLDSLVPGSPGVGNPQDTASAIRFTVVGTFDYFPTMYEEQAYVVVANLAHLQLETGGPLPFSVWARLQPEADTDKILAAVTHMGLTPVLKGDLPRLVRADRRRLERVGMFGMLSISFLASALLAGLSLLAHAIASMMGQRVRYAIWQALGMSRLQVMAVVSTEYLGVLLYGLLIGTAGGLVASRWYVPLVRVADRAGRPVPPFLPIINWGDAVWIVVAMGVTLLLAEVLILVRMVRAKVFENLRLGYRE